MVKELYKFEQDSQSISIQPNYYLLKKDFKWYALILFAAVICIPVMHQRFGENGLLITASLAVLMFFYILRDYIFKINVRYIFDKSTQAIYRHNPPFPQKKIMSFTEMVVFTQSETGGWHYALGIKKKQFLKNYCISQEFGSGKKSDLAKNEYEQEILEPILKLVES